MITTKRDLQEYMRRDMKFFRTLRRKDRFYCWLLRDPAYFIDKYIRLLRREEYHANKNRTIFSAAACFWFLARKNALGNKLGFKIPRNCFGPGLTVYHHGEIIVNESARIGADCSLHGGNCIGNNGKTDLVPHIGDHLDMGIGAKIIGNVTLGSHVLTGANAVVTSSFLADNITLVGIPARELKQE